jgi:uncharacterized SAM-binding protein YcdF (DUF218 family)
MFELKKLLTPLVLPPMGPMLLAAGGLLLAGRRSRAGRLLAGVAVLALMLMSIPELSSMAMRSLEIYPVVTAGDLQQADAIVILGGGQYVDAPEYGGDTVAAETLVRCRYGAWLARRSGLPVLVSGGAVFAGAPEAQAMVAVLGNEFGVPVRWVEDASRDTRDNASRSAVLLKAAGVKRVVLVSHAYHLPRAVPLFEAQGFTVIPAPTGFTTESASAWQRWLPSVAALRNMTLFCHEWLGRLFA